MSVQILDQPANSAIQEAVREVTPERIAALTDRLSDLLVSTIDHIHRLNRESNLLALNARIESARAGDSGSAFGVVAKAMSKLASKSNDSAKSLSEGSGPLINELADVTEQLKTRMRGDRLSDMAATAIDLVDRNLYERTCDVRWWATDDSLVQALSNPTPERVQHAGKRMGVILDAYTVYFDLVLCDREGRVLANGRPKNYSSVGSNVSETCWFKQALGTKSGDEFGFQSVHASNLVAGQRVLVYSCTVRRDGLASGEVLGVLGVIFNWDALGQVILDRIPLRAAEKIASRSAFIDDEGNVLADSPKGSYPSRLAPSDVETLLGNDKGYRATLFNGARQCAGHAVSQGFETYATGWHALVMVSTT